MQATPYVIGPRLGGTLLGFMLIFRSHFEGLSRTSTDLLKYMQRCQHYFIWQCGIFNLAFLTGVFPKDMQTAKTIVLHKGEEISNLDNYKPISILPVFSNGLEKIIHSKLTSFFEMNAIISNSQFGFPNEKRSTKLTLITHELIINEFSEYLLTPLKRLIA